MLHAFLRVFVFQRRAMDTSTGPYVQYRYRYTETLGVLIDIVIGDRSPAVTQILDTCCHTILQGPFF